MFIQHPILPVNLISSALLLVGVTVSLWYWSTKKSLTDARLIIAFGGLVGAFVGAKICYVIAEAPIWWNDPVFWLRILAGKTILGGLLGGWVGVEWAKHAVGESRMMGDEFARIIPCGISIGRLGCWIHGCCHGRLLVEVLPPAWSSRWEGMVGVYWPSPLIEISFQVVFFVFSLASKNVRWLKGQQFHVYLIAYGIFRTLHEPFRATVRYESINTSPYSVLAIFVACCGIVGFTIRNRTHSS